MPLTCGVKSRAMAFSETMQMRSEDNREAPPVAALLIGDRDLEGVAEQLRQMKVETFRIHDADERHKWREPEQLLVVSGRQALALETLPSREKRSFTAIAIFEESAKTFRAQLDPVGFDHLVQSPVHPERGLEARSLE